MSEKRKYLGKKRRKIFVIEKSLISQGTPKNLSVENENLSPIENKITSEELPTIKSSKINLNLSKKNEKNNLKIQKHSLINISNLVYDFLKKTVHTTGNDVTTHIKNIIQSNNNQPNQKNIQRRVYDAINVMCAVGLIKKNKQEIKFINYKNKNNAIKSINNINEEKEEEKSKSDETEEKINEKNNELQEKRNQLIKSYLTLKFYEKYNKLNKTNPLRMYENKLEFPFDLIIYDKTSDFHMQSKDDSSRYLLLSNSEFIHLNPYEIIKKLISYDIFLKLNENLNNVSENKSNSKKSTKSNSLIEEANSNIDKNKLISENNSQLNYTKKSKDEKDEDFIFEYLRNIKIFVDEIINNIQRKKENENNDETNKLEEEPDDAFEEKSINFFTGKKIRKNSNISNWSNFNEHNENNKINEDSISEITYFIQNFK